MFEIITDTFPLFWLSSPFVQYSDFVICTHKLQERLITVKYINILKFQSLVSEGVQWLKAKPPAFGTGKKFPKVGKKRNVVNKRWESGYKRWNNSRAQDNVTRPQGILLKGDLVLRSHLVSSWVPIWIILVCNLLGHLKK